MASFEQKATVTYDDNDEEFMLRNITSVDPREFYLFPETCTEEVERGQDLDAWTYTTLTRRLLADMVVITRKFKIEDKEA